MSAVGVRELERVCRNGGVRVDRVVVELLAAVDERVPAVENEPVC